MIDNLSDAPYPRSRPVPEWCMGQPIECSKSKLGLGIPEIKIFWDFFVRDHDEGLILDLEGSLAAFLSTTQAPT